MCIDKLLLKIDKLLLKLDKFLDKLAKTIRFIESMKTMEILRAKSNMRKTTLLVKINMRKTTLLAKSNMRSSILNDMGVIIPDPNTMKSNDTAS